MNVHVARLRRAQKVLPGIIRRAFASAPNTPPSATNGSAITEHARKIIKRSNKIASQLHKRAVKKEWLEYRKPSKVYWALTNIYEPGGLIPRAPDQYQLIDAWCRPLWGEWGVRLSIRTIGGPNVLTL